MVNTVNIIAKVSAVHCWSLAREIQKNQIMENYFLRTKSNWGN